MCCTGTSTFGLGELTLMGFNAFARVATLTASTPAV